jgi:hypothetical protein
MFNINHFTYEDIIEGTIAAAVLIILATLVSVGLFGAFFN